MHSNDVGIWLLTATAGALTSFVVFAFGAPGLAVVLLLLSGVVGTRRRLKIGGALAGFGGAALTIIAAANVRCAEFAAQPSSSCMAADISGAVVVALVVFVVGAALTSVARQRSS